MARGGHGFGGRYPPSGCLVRWGCHYPCCPPRVCERELGEPSLSTGRNDVALDAPATGLILLRGQLQMCVLEVALNLISQLPVLPQNCLPLISEGSSSVCS